MQNLYDKIFTKDYIDVNFKKIILINIQNLMFF
jgi:hypothetical protein